LKKLLSLSVRFFDKKSKSDLIMASYFDLKGIRIVTLDIGNVVLYLSRLVGLAVVAWLLSPKLAVIGIITIPFGALPAYLLGQRITRAAHKERDAVVSLYDSFLQVCSGIRIIKVNRGEQRILNRAGTIGHALYQQVVGQAQSKSLARFLLEAVSGLGLILVLTIGGRDVGAGVLNWQTLMSLLIAVMAIYSPMLGLLQVYSTIRSVMPNLDRVERILTATPDIQDAPQARPLVGAPQTIELRNVSFAYQEQPILHSLSATFQRGETVGIVGPSGSGKSSLLSLLLRLYDPTAGQILFDGVDLREIRRADLMDHCGIVLQEPFLFIDTIANNIRWTRPDADIDMVIEAAKAANIHHEIMQMDNGYETILGRRQDARGVSVGQKQRICIAAALLKNAPLLLLDEATSNLDSMSERAVQEAIERLMSGRTTFIIAHRLSTLRSVDRILVLDQGRLMGLGTHDQLMETCLTYQQLWNHQITGQEAEVALDRAEMADTVSNFV
jgi:subfamily B ATP-binding cassette protein MsbA